MNQLALIFIVLFAVLSERSDCQDLSYEVQSSHSENPILIELFTSQGCSSCPPADKWMTNKLHHNGLFKSFVPVVYHVDYWNYIGWIDIFSSEIYSNRQRAYSKFLKSNQIATPSFYVNGKLWPRWYKSNPLNAAKPDRSKLKFLISAKVKPERKIFISVTQDSKAKALESRPSLFLHLALLTTGIKSKIKGGENNGKVLQHDFSVLFYKQNNLRSDRKDGNNFHYLIPTSLPELKGQRQALAIWISIYPNGPVLQAFGSWIPYLY